MSRKQSLTKFNNKYFKTNKKKQYVWLMKQSV